MTYGEQVCLLELRLAQLRMRRDGLGLQGLLEREEAAQKIIVRLHNDPPTAHGFEPYNGYETLRGGDPADWSWHGPDGKVEK